MLFIQVVAAKEFLTVQNVTVIGLALFFIVICLYAIKVLYKSNESKAAYILENDKANLEVFLKLANHLGLVDQKIDNSHEKLDDIRNLIINKITNNGGR